MTKVICEYKPNGSYKRVITEAKARELLSQSGAEASLEEFVKWGTDPLVHESELDEEPCGQLFFSKA